MGYIIKGIPLGTPPTNDGYEECDIPVREGRVEDYRMKFIEERIDCDEQGHQRRVVVYKLLKLNECDYGKENNNT